MRVFHAIVKTCFDCFPSQFVWKQKLSWCYLVFFRSAWFRPSATYWRHSWHQRTHPQILPKMFTNFTLFSLLFGPLVAFCSRMRFVILSNCRIYALYVCISNILPLKDFMTCSIHASIACWLSCWVFQVVGHRVQTHQIPLTWNSIWLLPWCRDKEVVALVRKSPKIHTWSWNATAGEFLSQAAEKKKWNPDLN